MAIHPDIGFIPETPELSPEEELERAVHSLIVSMEGYMTSCTRYCTESEDPQITMSYFDTGDRRFDTVLKIVLQALTGLSAYRDSEGDTHAKH